VPVLQGHVLVVTRPGHQVRNTSELLVIKEDFAYLQL
jgi:hypothetical protein